MLADGGRDLPKIAIKAQTRWPRFTDIINQNETRRKLDGKSRCPHFLSAYFRLRDQRVLADVGTFEMIVYNLKSIGNFTNLNMSFTVYKLLISCCNLYKISIK